MSAPARLHIEGLESRRMLDATTSGALLTAADVSTILEHAARAARSTQAIVVVDREGNVLGEYDKSGLSPGSTTVTAAQTLEIRAEAELRARTAAFFESTGEAFTTRTARFIIQDHFPYPILNTPGGPLYGVEFSSGVGSDVLAAPAAGTPLAELGSALTPLGLSGDPGGVPIYKPELVNGRMRMMPAGAIGVAGDFHDIGPRYDLRLGLIKDSTGQPAFPYALAANPRNLFFRGAEEPDFDEAVALAGAVRYMAPVSIWANNVLIDGLRLPFIATITARPLRNLPVALADLIAAGDGTLATAPVDAAPDPFPAVTIDGVLGEYKRQNYRANPTTAGQNFAPVESNDVLADAQTAATRLTVADVDQILSDAVNTAKQTRAGIRNPIGSSATVHIAVVDRDGDLLGVFRMGDGTNFSYDVAVQKARTAAFFSDDTHAFSTRAIGFISQRFFPVGIDSGLQGPMDRLQDGLAYAGLNGSGLITDDSVKPIGTVTAAVADPTAGVIAVTAGSTPFTVGQIITFGEDTSNEYIITSTGPAGITVRDDGIDPSFQPNVALTPGEPIRPKNPLKDGITIFPGGVPLYKNGVFVGAIGVSGDGVDQDDRIAYGGTLHFLPPGGIRSDQLPASQITSFIVGKLQTIEQDFTLGTIFTSPAPPIGMDLSDLPEIAEARLTWGLRHLRLPYVKFPRNPGI